MATIRLGSNLSPAFSPSRLGHNSRESFFCFLKLNPTLVKPTIIKCDFAAKAVASSSSTAFVETNEDPTLDEKKFNRHETNLACPVCYDRLNWNGNPVLSVDSATGASLRCSACRKTYSGTETHLALTVASGGKGYGEPIVASTELFRLPLISFLYERGWRQSFSVWGGYPGPEKEFELIKDYLKPVFGGNIIDASCGSGLFARLFAKSGLFSRVVALDFSEAMLRQCYDFVKQDSNFPKENLILVRADISRLPFASRTVDAVHAGAALHCWPSPSAAVAEISRVLRPGGIFVATTHIMDGPFSLIPFLGPLRQNIAQVSGSHQFLSERELEDLCNSCGLVGFTCTRNRRFVMISARKP